MACGESVPPLTSIYQYFEEAGKRSGRLTVILSCSGEHLKTVYFYTQIVDYSPQQSCNLGLASKN